MCRIRKAFREDITAVAGIFDEIHTAEENGQAVIGWARGVYPVRSTAKSAVSRDDLFVLEDKNGSVLGAAIINQLQVDCYAQGDWTKTVPDEQVMVLHTLVISPSCSGKGYGKKFVSFYETYAAEHGCSWLRMDTNAKNTRARNMYRKLGYKEIGIVPTVFNGIEGVQLVLLEKPVGQKKGV